MHGYNVPELNAAAKAQLDRMSHVMFGGLTHAPAVALAERLVGITPKPLQRVFLCDSGPQVMIWIGSNASPKESAAAFDTANKYLLQASKPLTTEVTVLKEGNTTSCKRFTEIFSD